MPAPIHRLSFTHRRLLKGGAGSLLVLSLACALPGLLFSSSVLASDAWQRLEEAQQVIGDAAPQSDGLTLELPFVSEDGSAVALTVAVEAPLDDGDYIESIHLFATGNPNPEIAVFHLTPLSGTPEISTRVRLNESQDVVAVARSAEGQVWATSREVRVTVSGCLVRGDDLPVALGNPRVNLPGSFSAGEPGEVRTLISHPMETGLREGADGEILPRHIIERFTVSLDGETAFSAELHQSVSANPYLRFYLAPESDGEALFEWIDDSGESASETSDITVS